MSLDVGTLVSYLKIDDSQFDAKMSSGERRFKAMGGRLVQAAKVAGIAIGIGLVSQIPGAIRAASDLGETTSKTRQIFGDAADAIVAFGDTASDKLGQSKRAALDAAANFGIFGKAAGLTGNELVAFSTGLTSLSSDLASFGNTSPEAAAEALGAALRGESEPMRTYGVLLNEASIKAQALQMGLLKTTVDINKVKAAQVGAIEAQRKHNQAVKDFGPNSLQAQKASAALGLANDRLGKATEGTIGEMTQQQRVLAVSAAIYAQTKDAQGDFARTSDGLANQERILTARFEDTKAMLGQQLLPAATAFVGVLSDILGYVQDNQEWLVPLVGVLGGFAATIWLIVQAVKIWTAVQWALNIALNANPIGLIVLAVAILGGAIYLLWTHSAGFRDFFIGLWEHIWSYLKRVGAWITGPFVGYFRAVWGFISKPLIAYYSFVISTFVKLIKFMSSLPGKITAVAKGMWNGLVSAFKAAINWLIDLWNSVDLTINVKVPDWVPGFGGHGFSVPDVFPDLPHLKDGGYLPATPGGRLALMAEGGQGEYALPEDRLRDLLREAASTGGGTLHLIISGTGILRGIRENVRIGGGKVETVLVGG
jgi:hypothetical protein